MVLQLLGFALIYIGSDTKLSDDCNFIFYLHTTSIYELLWSLFFLVISHIHFTDFHPLICVWRKNPSHRLPPTTSLKCLSSKVDFCLRGPLLCLPRNEFKRGLVPFYRCGWTVWSFDRFKSRARPHTPSLVDRRHEYIQFSRPPLWVGFELEILMTYLNILQ